MKSDLAICYVADTDFLYPTLLSIASLRRFPAGRAASIFLFCLDPGCFDLTRLVAHTQSIGVTLQILNLKELLRHDPSKWNRTHVTEASLGRFYMEPLLPPEVERILYIDGDTLVVGDPAPLLAFEPPANTLAAAEDISFFSRNDWGQFGQRSRDYFAALRIAPELGYFNGGVLMARRAAWRSITTEAAEFLVQNLEHCAYHDQSAMNAVVGSRRIALSPAWNFQTPFRYWNVDASVMPRILHFTGFPKPWMADVPPWTEAHRLIEEMQQELASLELPRTRLSHDEIARFKAQFLRRRRRLALWPLRVIQRRRELLALVARAAV